jgi:predicted DNA binding CopG/RHH family protein
MRFELRPKDKTISLRLSQDLLDAVKGTAAAQGVPYHRYIRDAIERALAGNRKRGPA